MVRKMNTEFFGVTTRDGMAWVRRESVLCIYPDKDGDSTRAQILFSSGAVINACESVDDVMATYLAC